MRRECNALVCRLKTGTGFVWCGVQQDLSTGREDTRSRCLEQLLHAKRGEGEVFDDVRVRRGSPWMAPLRPKLVGRHARIIKHDCKGAMVALLVPLVVDRCAFSAPSMFVRAACRRGGTCRGPARGRSVPL